MTEHYDDIVIGAGSAGATLASRLSEDPQRKVLLIEGGPDYADDALPKEILDGSGPCTTSHDWGYQADSGVAGRPYDYIRGKIIGGTSSVNTAMGLRGMRADFAQWVAFGLPDWTWDDVVPFYKRLESDADGEGSTHGTDGPIFLSRNNGGSLRPIQAAFQDACVELGYKAIGDLNNPDVDAEETVGRVPMNVRDEDGVRVSTAIGYLFEARKRPNLTVVTDHLVDRVQVENGVATGVVTQKDGAEEIFTGDRITVSAGTFGTPAILMRSGIGPKDALAELGIESTADLAGVGANLMDHPFIPVILTARQGVCNDDDPLVQMLLRYTSTVSDEINDMQLMILSNLGSGGGAEDSDEEQEDKWRGSLEFAADTYIPALYVGLQKPYSRGRVTITSKDPADQPRIELAFLSDDRDRERIVEGIRKAVKLTKTAGLSSATDGYVNFSDELAADDAALNEYIDANLLPGYHVSGTARMGSADDEMAVVDGQFRVHGVSNLRVVDASVMPDIVRANPNLTVIMMGERASDLLKAEAH